jgi:hypothetical protein
MTPMRDGQVQMGCLPGPDEESLKEGHFEIKHLEG